MDGFELLDYIRSDVALKDTKVIVSSASVSLVDQQMALNHGGDDFLAKPVDAMALFEQLANLLQLEWTYQAIEKDEALGEGSLKEFVVPPHSLLEDWAELAQRGRILKLKSNLEQIGDSEPDYAQFIEPLLDLAKQFQVEAIEEKLRSYLAP